MAGNHREDLQRRLIRPLIWSIFAAVAIYSGSMILSDLSTVGASVTKLGAQGWALILSLSLLNYGLRFVRWEIYLRRLDSRIPGHLSLAYYIGGFAFTTTPAKAGEAVRSLYLKRHGVGYVQSLAAFFTERLVDLIAMVLLALMAALVFPAYRWPVLVITVVVIALLSLVHARPFDTLPERLLNRLPAGKLQSIGLRLMGLMRSASSLLKSGPLCIGIILAIIAWGAEGVAFHYILKALGVDISLQLAIGIYSVSILAGALSFIPGGIGSTEAVMVVLLTQVGTNTAVAVAATLICRIATLWFAVVIGLIVLAGLSIRDKANRRETSVV